MGSADSTEPAPLPIGSLARPATSDDAPAVAALRSAYLAEEGDPTLVTAEEQLNDWQGLNLAEDAVVALASDGSLVAHADILNRRFVQVSVYGGVDPRYRRRGLGGYLIRWGEAWARERMDWAPADAEIAVQHYINANNAAARRLMEAHSYAHVRSVYVMRIVMQGPSEAPAPIEGLRIRAFAPGQDERATYEAIEEAFADLWGRPPGDFDRWLGMTERERQHPDMWYLAEDEGSGEIAGVCLARIVPGDSGWIGSVGVRRPWRSRGLALALLRTAFGEFYRRGEREVTLSVDAENPSGALRLYTRAGMRVAQHIMLYRRRLRDGKDYSTLATEANRA